MNIFRRVGLGLVGVAIFAGGCGSSSGGGGDSAAEGACNDACANYATGSCADTCAAVCSDSLCSGVFSAADFQAATQIDCETQYVNFVSGSNTVACQIR